MKLMKDLSKAQTNWKKVVKDIGKFAWRNSDKMGDIENYTSNYVHVYMEEVGPYL